MTGSSFVDIEPEESLPEMTRAFYPVDGFVIVYRIDDDGSALVSTARPGGYERKIVDVDDLEPVGNEEWPDYCETNIYSRYR